MKVTQILKQQGRELYTLGLKLIFIYAEYSEPTLFASLMNLCMAKIPESIERIKIVYNWQWKMALHLKLPRLTKLMSRQISRVSLSSPGAHKRKSLLKPFTSIGSVKLEYG
ncbi:MAG: hypothetical protein JWP45_1092 [Mucilaginibacter sp.]|nr:hypothetical protein [Mucilaginibacter sp.]